MPGCTMQVIPNSRVDRRSRSGAYYFMLHVDTAHRGNCACCPQLPTALGMNYILHGTWACISSNMPSVGSLT